MLSSSKHVEGRVKVNKPSVFAVGCQHRAKYPASAMPSGPFWTPGMKDKDLKTGVIWDFEGFRGCKFWQPPGSETAQRPVSQDVKMKRRLVLSPVPPLSPPSCPASHKSGSHTRMPLLPSRPPSFHPSIHPCCLPPLAFIRTVDGESRADTPRGTDAFAQSAATCGGKHMCLVHKNCH